MAESSLPTRALTLYQPWAWLVASGHKDIENRPPGFSHKSFRGEFWIHAGRHCDENEFDGAQELALSHGILLPVWSKRESYALGCIVGRAEVIDIIPPSNSGRAWHFPHQWGFVLRNARVVEPVPCRGYQGFWRVPAPVLEQLRRDA
jgi:hypothetical protein